MALDFNYNLLYQKLDELIKEREKQINQKGSGYSGALDEEINNVKKIIRFLEEQDKDRIIEDYNWRVTFNKGLIGVAERYNDLEGLMKFAKNILKECEWDDNIPERLVYKGVYVYIQVLDLKDEEKYIHIGLAS